MTIHFVGDRKPLVINWEYIKSWWLDKDGFVYVELVEGRSDIYVNKDQILMIEE